MASDALHSKSEAPKLMAKVYQNTLKQSKPLAKPGLVMGKKPEEVSKVKVVDDDSD